MRNCATIAPRCARLAQGLRNAIAQLRNDCATIAQVLRAACCANALRTRKRAAARRPLPGGFPAASAELEQDSALLACRCERGERAAAHRRLARAPRRSHRQSQPTAFVRGRLAGCGRLEKAHSSAAPAEHASSRGAGASSSPSERSECDTCRARCDPSKPARVRSTS